MGKELEIYDIITKKRYNRDEPNLKKKVFDKIQRFVSRHKPIKLVGFWGVGLKDRHNWADANSCEFLDKLNIEVKKVYNPGIEFIFIFATKHGIHNGIGKKIINSYTKDMKKLFKKFNFKYVYLDSLWKKYKISFDRIDEIFKKKPKNWWNKIYNSKELEKAAKVRNHRLPPKEAAQKYYIFRNFEKKMLEKEFVDSIFHAFTDSNLKNVLPNLPTLYLYSFKKKRSCPPWFVSKETNE